MRKRALYVLGAAVLGAGRLCSQTPLPVGTGPLAPAWQEAATFLYNDAFKSFSDARGKSGVDERERQFGEAITRLNIQPRTAGNIEASRETFEQLLAANPNDDAGVFAAYFLARIHQFYEDPPKLDVARKLYHTLIEEHAGNPIAEAAASTLVLMDVYEEVSPEERARRFAELEKLGPLLKTSAGRRDYDVAMGFAYGEFHFPKAKEIEYLVAADKEGITRWQTESNAWLAIAEAARADGQKEVSEKYYRLFVDKYTLDNRRFTVKERLDSLVANGE